jgi:hypothetical protein
LIVNIKIVPLTFSAIGLEIPHLSGRGVLWAAQAAKMGFRWNIGNGRSVMFWEDQWFDHCCLAIQYRDIYTIFNEHGVTVREA